MTVSTQGHIAVIGIPFDGNSSYLRGAAAAPGRIRDAVLCPSSNMWCENGRDLGCRDAGWSFVGDLELVCEGGVFAQIESALIRRLARGERVVSLGGDHSITFPLVKAHASVWPALNILHFDAHPDLYDELDGNRSSHACPFARILEKRLARRLVQVGIRTMNGHQRQQAARFGVEVIGMDELALAAKLQFDGPVYLSLDLDCLDPAFAPGVSHHEPGGLTTRELLRILQHFQGVVVGADIVEYNPRRDAQGTTAMVAAKLLKEILARMLASPGQAVGRRG